MGSNYQNHIFFYKHLIPTESLCFRYSYLNLLLNYFEFRFSIPKGLHIYRKQWLVQCATPMGSNKHETLMAINILPLWGKLEEIRKQFAKTTKLKEHIIVDSSSKCNFIFTKIINFSYKLNCIPR